MLTPLILFGLGQLETPLVLEIVALLFGQPVMKLFEKRSGIVVSPTERATEEFEAGREAE